jgi:hypothetical protein
MNPQLENPEPDFPTDIPKNARHIHAWYDSKLWYTTQEERIAMTEKCLKEATSMESFFSGYPKQGEVVIYQNRGSNIYRPTVNIGWFWVYTSPLLTKKELKAELDKVCAERGDEKRPLWLNCIKVYHRIFEIGTTADDCFFCQRLLKRKGTTYVGCTDVCPGKNDPYWEQYLKGLKIKFPQHK